MAVTYGFFNSVNGDRKYNADTMSEFYTGICSQGVFQSVDNGLAVSAGTGLTVNVATGRAIIQGHWVKNDAALTLSIDAASATYARIDAVVIRYSASNRNIQIVVKTGTPAASPSAPSMTRAGGVYELCLAYVNVAANATSVTVTDKRSNTSVCGWAAVAQAIDGTYEALIDDIKTGFDGVVYQNPGDAVRGEDEKLSNKIDIQNGGSYTFVDGKYINSNGGESSGSGLSYLDYYPVVPNGYVHIETYMAYGMSIAFFDENKTFITGSAIQNSSGSIGVKFTVDVNCSASAHYVRVSVNGTNKKDLLVINKLAISIPYKVSQLQNDRQFLTEESVDDLTEKVDSLFDISPNLWSPSDTTIGKLSTDNGSVNTSLTDYVTSDFIPFRSGESVYVYYKTISTGEVHLVTPEMGNASGICLYDDTKTFVLGRYYAQYTYPYTIADPNTHYVRIGLARAHFENTDRIYGIFKTSVTNVTFEPYYSNPKYVEKSNDFSLIAYGDSLTAGTGATDTAHRYIDQCKTALGAKNCAAFGYGGSGSKSIAFTAGALSAYITPSTNSFALKYADLTSNVTIYNNQLNGKIVIIDDQEYVISQSDSTAYSLPNTYTPSDYYKPVVVKNSRYTADIYIIWVGTNSSGYTWDILDAMVDKLPHKNYVIMGLTRLGTDTTIENELKCYEKFGSHFFNTRVQIINNAFPLLGKTPTAEDTAAMNAGLMPPSLLYDTIHFNDDGYEAIGKLLALHIKSLGYDYQIN